MPDRFSKRKSSFRAEALPATSLPAQLGNQGMLLQFQRHKFTQEEDAILQQLVDQYGTNKWLDIATCMPPCTARQCKERWTNFLSPVPSENPWTPDEDIRLEELVTNLGTKWNQIATTLSRSVSSCENRWSKVNHYEPGFSRKKSSPRWLTMYGMMHGGLQGPHTFPFGLWDAAAQNMDFSTLSSVVPTYEEFENSCISEDIVLEPSEIDTYKRLHKQFMTVGKAQTDPSDYAFPGNMHSLGFTEAGNRMINMLPHTTYNWREGLDLSSKEGRAAIAGKGTELAAINALRNGSLTQDKIMASIDGFTNNGYIHPEQFQDQMNRMGKAVFPKWDPKAFDKRFP